MKIIDTHVHFWTPSIGNHSWMHGSGPRFMGDVSSVRHDFGPSDLERLAIEAGLELSGVVSLEAEPDDPLTETVSVARKLDKYDSQRSSPFRAAMAIRLDLSASNAKQALEEQLAVTDRIRGVRQILNVHHDQQYTYVNEHFMQNPQWKKNLQLLIDHDLHFEAQVYPSQMHELAELAREYPQITFVLNHGGMLVDRKSLEGWRQWRNGIRELASQSNIVAKLSGFAMLDRHWTEENLGHHVFELIDAFGIERCVCASNFPVEGLFKGYADIWWAFIHLFEGMKEEEKQALLAGNAERIYRL